MATAPDVAGNHAWIDLNNSGTGLSKTTESLIIFGAKLFASISKAKDRMTRIFFMVNYTRNHRLLLRAPPLNLLWKNRHVHSSFEKEDPDRFS